jgi:hypothetical protein
VELGEPYQDAVVAGVAMVEVEPGKSSQDSVGDAMKLCAVGNARRRRLGLAGQGIHSSGHWPERA